MGLIALHFLIRCLTDLRTYFKYQSFIAKSLNTKKAYLFQNYIVEVDKHQAGGFSDILP